MEVSSICSRCTNPALSLASRGHRLPASGARPAPWSESAAGYWAGSSGASRTARGPSSAASSGVERVAGAGPELRSELEVAPARPVRQDGDQIPELALGIQLVQRGRGDERQDVTGGLGVPVAAAKSAALRIRTTLRSWSSERLSRRRRPSRRKVRAAPMTRDIGSGPSFL